MTKVVNQIAAAVIVIPILLLIGCEVATDHDQKPANTSSLAASTGDSAASIATAIVGEWSCQNDDGTVEQRRYSADGQFSSQTPGNPNADAPITRARNTMYGNYQLSGSKLTFAVTRIRTEFALADAENAQSLASAFTEVRMTGPNEIEMESQGSGGSADISIDGSKMQYRRTSDIHKGVESSVDAPASICSLVGR